MVGIKETEEIQALVRHPLSPVPPTFNIFVVYMNTGLRETVQQLVRFLRNAVWTGGKAII